MRKHNLILEGLNDLRACVNEASSIIISDEKPQNYGVDNIRDIKFVEFKTKDNKSHQYIAVNWYKSGNNGDWKWWVEPRPTLSKDVKEIIKFYVKTSSKIKGGKFTPLPHGLNFDSWEDTLAFFEAESKK